MHVELKYGSGTVSFDVPDGSIGAIVRAREAAGNAGPPGPAVELGAAVEDCRGRRVLVLVADGTREQPHRAACAALAPALRAAGSVRVLLATGTHRADTADDRRIIEEWNAASAEHRVPLASAGAHDCRTSDTFDAGATSRGNRVRLHRAVEAADVVLIVSDMKPHYFAGYSNPIKFLLPGVAAFESIERNHALALDPDASHCRHPLHPDPRRRRNPVAEDQLEAARLVTAARPVTALVTAVTAGDDWAVFGPLEKAVAEGIRHVDARLVRRVGRRFARAVISCGGYPHDETLYTAQRALELSKEALADGAEVLWLAECRNGIAASDDCARGFFDPLKGDTAAFIEEVRRRYVMFSHKTVKFAEMMERLSAVHVVSALPGGTLPAGGLRPCDAPHALVADWARSGEPILFVDDANRLALTLSGD